MSVASIPPRCDSEQANEKVATANVAIKKISSDMSVTFVDNDPSSFKLANGAVNDGYIVKDGLHQTAPGSNRLARNLKLSIVEGILDITKLRRGAANSRHEDRHGERRPARDTRNKRDSTTHRQGIQRDELLGEKECRAVRRRQERHSPDINNFKHCNV